MINCGTIELVFAFPKSPANVARVDAPSHKKNGLELAFFAGIRVETYLLKGRASRPRTACKSRTDSQHCHFRILLKAALAKLAAR